MASEHDTSAFVQPLPDRPNLEMQQKRAKELLRAAWAADVGALTRIRALHPKPPATDALAHARLACLPRGAAPSPSPPCARSCS